MNLEHTSHATLQDELSRRLANIRKSQRKNTADDATLIDRKSSWQLEIRDFANSNFSFCNSPKSLTASAVIPHEATLTQQGQFPQKDFNFKRKQYERRISQIQLRNQNLFTSLCQASSKASKQQLRSPLAPKSPNDQYRRFNNSNKQVNSSQKNLAKQTSRAGLPSSPTDRVTDFAQTIRSFQAPCDVEAKLINSLRLDDFQAQEIFVLDGEATAAADNQTSKDTLNTLNKAQIINLTFESILNDNFQAVPETNTQPQLTFADYKQQCEQQKSGTKCPETLTQINNSTQKSQNKANVYQQMLKENADLLSKVQQAVQRSQVTKSKNQELTQMISRSLYRCV